MSQFYLRFETSSPADRFQLHLISNLAV